MLTSLHIENIALIESADIELDRGLNILTGETGAGKSILIDAIHAVLGERTSRELIRTGCQSACVSAVFDDCDEPVLAFLRDSGFPCEDSSVLLQRRLTGDGKNVCRINGNPATTATLRQIGEKLLNIHGQQDNQSLLDPSWHMEYLDALGHLQVLAEDYRACYKALTELTASRGQLIRQAEEQRRQVDFLQYQIAELENAQIRVGEREELTERKNHLTHFEKITQSVSAALQILNGDENENPGAVSALREAENSLSSVSQYSAAFPQICERLQNLGYELEDLIAELHPFTEENRFDPGELEQIEERLDLLYRLGRKYGETEEEMLAVLCESKEKLDTVEHFEERLQELTEQLKQQTASAWEKAKKLSEARKEVAQKMSQQVAQELKELDMPDVVFLVSFEPCELNADGCDLIEFLISANRGEEPRPLVKVASGGELSRIMLAIKSVLSDADPVGTMIFDEIDSGTSGRAAQKIGKKLCAVAQGRQVICVTHLAQIACFADRHLLIQKFIDGERTKTSVTPLEMQGRVEELARIIGGESISETTLCAARELLTKGAEK